MKNQVNSGQVIAYANASGDTIAAGSVVVMGKMCGVAIANILNNTSGPVAISGVYTLTKKTLTDVVAQGDVIVDATGPVVISAATTIDAAILIGRAVTASNSATATVNVKLGL